MESESCPDQASNRLINGSRVEAFDLPSRLTRVVSSVSLGIPGETSSQFNRELLRVGVHEPPAILTEPNAIVLRAAPRTSVAGRNAGQGRSRRDVRDHPDGDGTILCGVCLRSEQPRTLVPTKLGRQARRDSILRTFVAKIKSFATFLLRLKTRQFIVAYIMLQIWG